MLTTEESILKMTKSGSKRDRLDSLKTRVENTKFGDVTLAEFADSNVPKGKGRLRKSKNVLQEVKKIVTSHDLDVNNVEDEDEAESLERKIDSSEGNSKESKENNNYYTEYPLKIWLLIADFISPEDVKSFSLVCKATLSVVNTPLFWIRLYKRYYTKKVVAPKCLSNIFLDYQIGLKQRVIRSLYYFYTPFATIAANYSPPIESVSGHVCLHHWVYRLEEKDSNEGSKWVFNFKLCNRNLSYILKNKKKKTPHLCDIHYNPEKGCSLLKFVGKEFIALPNVMGMRLKKATISLKLVTLHFSSAPLSRKSSDIGTLVLNLEFQHRPRLIPWWHPDYWDHGKCCKHFTKA